MSNRKTETHPAAHGRHDHRHCVATALAAAVERCAASGAQLTPIRRRVLELVWSSHAPIGAYDILAKLAADTGKVQPPTVYRALDFLKAQGLIHRIESRNAFIGCAQPDREHARPVPALPRLRRCRRARRRQGAGGAGARRPPRSATASSTARSSSPASARAASGATRNDGRSSRHPDRGKGPGAAPRPARGAGPHRRRRVAAARS